MKKKINKVYMLEVIVMLISICLFFIPLSHYSYNGNDFYSEKGIYLDNLFDVNESGIYVDNSMMEDETDICIISPESNLHLGTYDVTLKYLTDEHNRYTCSSKYETYPVITKRVNISLEPTTTSEDGYMTLTLDTPYKVDGYKVSFNYIGNGYLYVYGLEIQETAWWKWRILLSVVFISILVNVFQIFSHSTDKAVMGVLFALLATSVFATLPFLGVAVFGGHDFGFHLGRIEALKTSIENGQIPSRISSFWLGGRGYAASIFYCDLFLLLPAIMRCLGSTVQESLVFYILIVNVVTCYISFYCLKKMSNSNIGSLLATVIYVLSPYRLSCIYTRAAMGEYTGLIFVPLVFYGVYRIYEFDSESEDSLTAKFRRIIPLIFGISGIISCHVLTGVIVAIFGIIILVFNWKKTISKRVLVDFAFAIILVLLINAWYLVPFIQVFKSGITAGTPGLNGRFRSNGALIWQLVSLFPYSGDSMSVEEGFFLDQNNEMSYAAGVSLIILIAYILLRLVNAFPKDLDKKVVHFADTIAIIAALAFYMTTVYFPWDFVKQSSKLLLLVTQNIQFPWRFLGMAMFFSALLASLIIAIFKKKGEKWGIYGNMLSCIVAVVILVSSSFYYTDLCRNTEWLYLVDSSDGASDDVMGGEYLPKGIDGDNYMEFDYPIIDNGEIISWKREKGNSYVEVINSTSSCAVLTVPILYYTGYHAKDAFSGEELELKNSENAYTCIAVPSGFTGTIKIYYSEPLMWRICELISIITFLIVIICWIRLSRKTVVK